MKTFSRLQLILAVVLFGSTLASAKDSQVGPEERKALLQVRQSIWNAWFNNDQATLKAMLPANTIAINNGEDAWQTRDEVIKAAAEFHKAGSKLVSLRFPKTEIQRYGDVVIYYSLFETVIEAGGQQSTSSGRATEIFVKQGDNWVNSGWHLDSGK